MKAAYLIMALLVSGALMPGPVSAANGQGAGDSTGVKGWASDGGKYVVLWVPRQNRTGYFVNDASRLCFSFWVPGRWYPMPEPGLLEADHAQAYVGAWVLSAAQLKNYQGKDLLSRAVSRHLQQFEQRFGRAPKSSRVESFKSSLAGSIRWSADWDLDRGGHTQLAEVVRVMAKVKPGWVVVVTTSHGTDGAATARDILKSFTTSSESGCFRGEIRKLRGRN